MNAQTAHSFYPQEKEVGSFLGLGLGLEKENGLFFLALFLTGLAVALLLILTNGNVYVAAALVLAVGTMLLTLYRADVGFMLFVGAVLLFDQFFIPNAEPFTFRVFYFRNIKEIPYLPSVGAAVLNPLELHLLLVASVWFVVAALKGELQPVRVLFSWGALLFFAGVVGFLIYGLRNDGHFLTALWEVRALFYFGLVYFFTPQIIRTKEQIHLLLWVCMGAITFKAIQGFARFAALGFSFHGIPTLTNHEDPIFMLSLILLLFALTMYNAKTPQRWVLLLLLFPLIMGFYVAQRRAAYAAIVPVFLTLIALLQKKERWLFMKTVVPIFIVAVLYLAVFWESESRLASPIKLVKTGLSLDPEAAGERYYSNLYREIEKYDLARTVQRVPWFGVGFGNKYDQPIPLVWINFPLRDYIPHNEILWLLVKTGAVGFFLFFLFLNGFAVQATQTLLRTSDPYLKAVCAMAITAIVSQIIVSYFDLQLTYYRNMVYLGTLMGLVSSIDSISKASTQQQASEQ